MDTTRELRHSIGAIGTALRRPEELALRWRDRGVGAAPGSLIIPVLLGNAILGMAAYGLTMHLHEGFERMLWSGVFATLAAGTAWALALPARYILGAQLGSRLDFSTTLLAASLTVSFGALAMLASVPVNWFFSLALPYSWARLAVNLLVFAGVGVCMSDVLLRVLRALEPERSEALAYVWLGLIGVLGAELFWLLGLFQF